MTASISDLLDRAYSEACAIAMEVTDRNPTRLGELLAGWPLVAASVVRALRALPISPTTADTGLASALAVLNPVAQPAVQWRAKRIHYDPDPRLETMARCYGAIADLLVGETTLVLTQPAGAEQLRHALLRPLAVAADATLEAWTDGSERISQRWHLHWIRGLAEASSQNPAPGLLGGLAAVPAGEPGLDGAIQNWASTSREALLEPTRVSRHTFETAARGIVLLTAAAAIALQAAHSESLLQRDPRSAISTLIQANKLWLSCAVWPQHVNLEGPRNPNLRDAAAELRNSVDDAMRDGPRWAESAEIFRRNAPEQLIGALGRGLRATSDVGALHFAGLHELVRGRRQLWIASRAVNERTADPETFAAIRHGQWIPMPRHQPEGPSMLWTAEEAADATRAASGAAAAVLYGGKRDRVGHLLPLAAVTPSPSLRR